MGGHGLEDSQLEDKRFGIFELDVVANFIATVRIHPLRKGQGMQVDGTSILVEH